ncbi:MAG TPA: TIGR04283 family arsenosugar biosynthesis glycosyltransferase [Pyrinomonadaceae bacterium]|nr:TIGR04283 family arsenosugar biosynthesis glycosyltransferase [Pyrinomonadaceae bacterium]
MNSIEPPTLSIIIPTLNEAHSIGKTLDSVARLLVPSELVVVDGGSNDRTRNLADAHGAKVIRSESGRGRQMHIGACAAKGELLWFLHADTIVPTEATKAIVAAMRNPTVVAGNFEVRFDGAGTAPKFMTWFYPRLRRLGLCYGDSAFFVRREAYFKVGGFKAFPIFEDLDLLRRLRMIGRFVHLPLQVVTSSRRFEGRNFAITFTRWLVMQLLYWLGVNPRRLGRFYNRHGATKKRLSSTQSRSTSSKTDIYHGGEAC